MMKNCIASSIAGCALLLVASCANNVSSTQAPNTVTVAVNFVNHCPDSVMPVTATCAAGSGYDSTTVCITPESTANKIAIEWVKGSGFGSGDDFKIAFAKKEKACVTKDDVNPHKQCKIKAKGKYNYDDADGLAFKYAVIASGTTACATDPIIIIMR